jgi:putative tryptophan/tyrosine transport system substrate-binding protein
MIRVVQEAARERTQLPILQESNVSEIDRAFGSLVELGADGLVIGAEPFLFGSRREQLLALALRYAIPAIYEAREAAAAGGLISYGVDLTDLSRQAGIYAGRILKRAKPSDLPVEQPTRFELVINLKTAKALGLTIPPDPRPRRRGD